MQPRWGWTGALRSDRRCLHGNLSTETGEGTGHPLCLAAGLPGQAT